MKDAPPNARMRVFFKADLRKVLARGRQAAKAACPAATLPSEPRALQKSSDAPGPAAPAKKSGSSARGAPLDARGAARRAQPAQDAREGRKSCPTARHTQHAARSDSGRGDSKFQA